MPQHTWYWSLLIEFEDKEPEAAWGSGYCSLSSQACAAAVYDSVQEHDAIKPIRGIVHAWNYSSRECVDGVLFTTEDGQPNVIVGG